MRLLLLLPGTIHMYATVIGSRTIVVHAERGGAAFFAKPQSVTIRGRDRRDW